MLNSAGYNCGVTKIPTEKEARKWIEKARFKKSVEDFVGGVDTEIVVRQMCGLAVCVLEKYETIS